MAGEKIDRTRAHAWIEMQPNQAVWVSVDGGAGESITGAQVRAYLASIERKLVVLAGAVADKIEEQSK
jgi:hypothetical protein